jgi:hypothetical protein
MFEFYSALQGLKNVALYQTCIAVKIQNMPLVNRFVWIICINKTIESVNTFVKISSEQSNKIIIHN